MTSPTSDRAPAADTAITGQRHFRTALRELSSAQKTGAGVPAYTRYINRPLGRLAAATAYRIGLSPNQVSVLSGLVSLAAIVVLACLEPTWGVGLLVAVGLVLGYALDSADGQLARLSGRGNRAGEWLDHVIDSARMPAVHVGVLIALYRFADGLSPAVLLLPLAYLLVTTVRFFALILAEQMLAGAEPDPAPASSSAVRSLIALPGDFGLLCVLFVLWPTREAFLVLYGALCLAGAVLLVLSLVRRYRELSRR